MKKRWVEKHTLFYCFRKWNASDEAALSTDMTDGWTDGADRLINVIDMIDRFPEMCLFCRDPVHRASGRNC